MGTTVFPDGPRGAGIHLDLNGSATEPIRVYYKERDTWELMSVDDVLNTFSRNEAKDVLSEAMRYGQNELTRHGDDIVLMSKSIPGLELVYEVTGAEYRDAKDDEEGDSQGRVVAREKLDTEGTLRYERRTLFTTDVLRQNVVNAFSNQLSNGQGLF